MVGDVVGRTGRYFFAEQTPELRQTKNIDIVVVNGENAAHGRGLTPQIFDELIGGGADVVTSGNHIWDNSNVMQISDSSRELSRRYSWQWLLYLSRRSKESWSAESFWTNFHATS